MNVDCGSHLCCCWHQPPRVVVLEPSELFADPVDTEQQARLVSRFKAGSFVDDDIGV